ncbi:phosphate signaling complex protein PhoU [bacterium]|nr:phosphate signaling complex protein PhoU [bacterium]
MPVHLRRDLEKLKRLILAFGASVEENTQLAANALRTYDSELAQRVIDRDEEHDRTEVQIEEECLKILALHQPVAVDLRYVVTVLKVNADLERIADFSVNVAKRASSLSKSKPIALPKELLEMSNKAISMVKHTLDALVEQDIVRARAVCASDDEVDLLQRELYDIIVKNIHEHPDQVSEWMQVFSCVRYFERMGDLATNISEDVIYLVEGEVIRHKNMN